MCCIEVWCTVVCTSYGICTGAALCTQILAMISGGRRWACMAPSSSDHRRQSLILSMVCLRAKSHQRDTILSHIYRYSFRDMASGFGECVMQDQASLRRFSTPHSLLPAQRLGCALRSISRASVGIISSWLRKSTIDSADAAFLSCLCVRFRRSSRKSLGRFVGGGWGKVFDLER